MPRPRLPTVRSLFGNTMREVTAALEGFNNNAPNLDTLMIEFVEDLLSRERVNENHYVMFQIEPGRAAHSDFVFSSGAIPGAVVTRDPATGNASYRALAERIWDNIVTARLRLAESDLTINLDQGTIFRLFIFQRPQPRPADLRGEYDMYNQQVPDRQQRYGAITTLTTAMRMLHPQGFSYHAVAPYPAVDSLLRSASPQTLLYLNSTPGDFTCVPTCLSAALLRFDLGMDRDSAPTRWRLLPLVPRLHNAVGSLPMNNTSQYRNMRARSMQGKKIFTHRLVPQLVQALYGMLGSPYNTPWSFNDIELLVNAINRYLHQEKKLLCVHVVDCGMAKRVIFNIPQIPLILAAPPANRCHIYLAASGSHMHLVSRTTPVPFLRFLQRKSDHNTFLFCFACGNIYYHTSRHQCEGNIQKGERGTAGCYMCNHTDCSGGGWVGTSALPYTTCGECNGRFVDAACKERHYKTLCKKRFICWEEDPMAGRSYQKRFYGPGK